MSERERQLSLEELVGERLPPPPRGTAASTAYRRAQKARRSAASQAAREAKIAARESGSERCSIGRAADAANRATLARPLLEFLTSEEATILVNAQREERLRRQAATEASQRARREAIDRGAGKEEVGKVGDQAYQQAYHAATPAPARVSVWHPTRCMEAPGGPA